MSETHRISNVALPNGDWIELTRTTYTHRVETTWHMSHHVADYLLPVIHQEAAEDFSLDDPETTFKMFRIINTVFVRYSRGLRDPWAE
jgi:hypothetical protein